jgi:CBS domain containing-hemolysin-like protein
MLAVQILLVLGLVALNGFLAMSELAIVCARRARLQRRADLGSRGARIAIELSDNPTRFLSTPAWSSVLPSRCPSAAWSSCSRFYLS